MVCVWLGDWLSDSIGLTIKGDKTQQCRYICGAAVSFFVAACFVFISFTFHFRTGANSIHLVLCGVSLWMAVAYDAFR